MIIYHMLKKIMIRSHMFLAIDSDGTWNVELLSYLREIEDTINIF